MSKPDQNVLKVLGVVFHRPPDRIRIPFPPGILLRCFLYPIYAVQESLCSAFRGSSGGGVWVGAVIGIEPSEQAPWEGRRGWKRGFGWMSFRWDVTLYFYLLCCLVVKYLAVLHSDGNSRTSILDCWRYKLKRNSEISEEELFIGPQVTLNFNLLNTLKNL